MVTLSLGSLCRRGHDHGGGSLRTRNGSCIDCLSFTTANYKKQSPAALRKNGRDWKRKNLIAGLLMGAKHRAGGVCTVVLADLLPFPSHCPLLGTKLDYSGTSKDVSARPSLDRKDPKQGYVKGNVWIVSMRANQIKNDATVEELTLLLENWRKAL